jgi:hypothetical protein
MRGELTVGMLASVLGWPSSARFFGIRTLWNELAVGFVDCTFWDKPTLGIVKCTISNGTRSSNFVMRSAPFVV